MVSKSDEHVLELWRFKTRKYTKDRPLEEIRESLRRRAEKGWAKLEKEFHEAYPEKECPNITHPLVDQAQPSK